MAVSVYVVISVIESANRIEIFVDAWDWSGLWSSD